MKMPVLLKNVHYSRELEEEGLRSGRLALGTAGLGGVWGKVDPRASVDTILYALEHGITVLDTAPAYSQAESFVGQALSEWKGPIPLISTKIGRLQTDSAESGLYDYSYRAMRQSILNSLELFGQTCLDIVFLHDPVDICPAIREEVIESVGLLKEEGLMRYAGLGGNLDAGWRTQLRSGLFQIVMNYNNVNACCLDGLQEDYPVCMDNGIFIYQGSPLHMGLLGRRLEQYALHPPEWVTPRELDIALRVKLIADVCGIPLASLAHQFLFSVAGPDRIVIGPRNMQDLKSALSDFAAGAIAPEIFHQITQIIMQYA